jgi:hypothetical protein
MALHAASHWLVLLQLPRWTHPSLGQSIVTDRANALWAPTARATATKSPNADIETAFTHFDMRPSFLE